MIALIANLASEGRPFAVIEHVVTLAEFRGRGLARATMQRALDFAWSRNCCKVMLLSGMLRPEAHRLYETLGFRGDVERGFVIKPKSSLQAGSGTPESSSHSAIRCHRDSHPRGDACLNPVSSPAIRPRPADEPETKMRARGVLLCRL